MAGDKRKNTVGRRGSPPGRKVVKMPDNPEQAARGFNRRDDVPSIDNLPIKRTPVKIIPNDQRSAAVPRATARSNAANEARLNEARRQEEASRAASDEELFDESLDFLSESRGNAGSNQDSWGYRRSDDEGGGRQADAFDMTSFAQTGDYGLSEPKRFPLLRSLFAMILIIGASTAGYWYYQNGDSPIFSFIQVIPH